MKNNEIAIVGAGITGLTAGWMLQKAGCHVTLFERRSWVGGAIRSDNPHGWLIEYGPNTLRLKNRRVQDFLKSAGLESRIEEANPNTQKRFIVKNGMLQKAPASIVDFIKTPLFSTWGKLKILKEPFIRCVNEPDETLASFVRRRLGEEVLEYAVNPFIAGVYAGSPDRLSVKHAFPKLFQIEQESGSLTKGMIKRAVSGKNKDDIRTRLISFSNGLQELPDMLSKSIEKIHLGTEVERVQRNRDGWEIQAGGFRYGAFDKLILNIPLYHFSEQFINGGAGILDICQITEYPPLSVVMTGYESSQIKHPLDGFGFLVPEAEERQILGSLFNSTLFPGRAPTGKVLITSFVGGSRQPELAKLDSDRIKKLVTGDLEDLLNINGEPLFFDHVFWPNSIPQYTVQYDRVYEAVEHLERQHSGLKIAGNFRGGIALPDCIVNGMDLAEEIVTGEE